MARPMKSFDEKLWPRVIRGAPDQCWEWAGAKSGPGYGHMSHGRNKTIGVHRVSFFLANGHWPEVVMHTCDNPSCCNPAHLVGGAAKDNVADMRRKNRGNNYGRGVRRPTITGEKNHASKLTDETVREILSSRESQRFLAAKYNVSRRAITFIQQRKTWRHVTPP